MDQLKEALTSTSFLALPNNYIVFIVETYACDYRIGLILMQEVTLLLTSAKAFP